MLSAYCGYSGIPKWLITTPEETGNWRGYPSSNSLLQAETDTGPFHLQFSGQNQPHSPTQPPEGHKMQPYLAPEVS